MGDDTKIIRFHHLAREVDVVVSIETCCLLDVVMEFEDFGRALDHPLDFIYPNFKYAYEGLLIVMLFIYGLGQ